MAGIPFEQLHVGLAHTLRYLVTEDLIDRFVALSGDSNPLHIDGEAARKRGFRARVAHGALLQAKLSTLIGVHLPGDGALWIGQQIDYITPVHPGDEVDLTGTVRHLSPASRTVVLDIAAHRVSDGAVLARGKAKVNMPEQTELPTELAYSDMTVLVTGASRGLGRAIALSLARSGASLVLQFHRNVEAANSVADEVRALGRSVRLVRADLTSESGIQEFAEGLPRHGSLQGFVHCATPAIERKPWIDTQREELVSHLSVGVHAADSIVRALYPAMRDARFGRIVLVSSSVAWGRPPANLLPYTVVKHAVRGLVRALAVELGPSGICVNCVSPGLLDTDNSATVSGMAKRMESAQTPLRRLASLDDVAGVVVGLLGPMGGFVTGADVPITGGVAM